MACWQRAEGVKRIGCAGFWLLVISLSSGCETFNYYHQAVAGHWGIYSQRIRLQQLIDSPDTSPELKQRLQLTKQIRAFAVTELQLPDNGSYRHYVDLKRPYVVWNVVAAPELSLEPHQWCYLWVGCFGYQGYFDEVRANNKAREMAEEGWDVMVGGVRAYSTLGWLADPLLNTFVSDKEWQLAAVLFHELAHQQLYVPNDTTFNESFARTVERLGVRRWFNAKQQPEALQQYTDHSAREAAFTELQLDYRARLQELYNSDVNEAAKRHGKAELLRELQDQAYPAFRQQWNNIDYDAWMAVDVNNAKLAMVAQYHQWVPAFELLLERYGHNLPDFYQAVEELANLSVEDRQLALEELMVLVGKSE